MTKKVDSVLERDEVDTGFSSETDRFNETAKPLFSRERKETGRNKTDGLDIEDMVLEGRRQIDDYEDVKVASVPLSDVSSTDVKEFLREKVGNLTIEGTIHEMYMTIKGMETQLRKVLDINASLEKDLKVTKETLINVNKENKDLSSKIETLENEGPSRMELERELQELIIQHNKKQEEIQDIVNEKYTIESKVGGLCKDIERLQEEKDDSGTETSILKTKVDDLIFKIKDRDVHIKKIHDENVELQRKIRKREQEISTLIEENKAISIESKESREAFDEIYDSLIAASIKTKKFFDHGLEEKSGN